MAKCPSKIMPIFYLQGMRMVISLMKNQAEKSAVLPLMQPLSIAFYKNTLALPMYWKEYDLER